MPTRSAVEVWNKIGDTSGDIPMDEPKNEPRPSMVAFPVKKVALPSHLVDEPTVTMIFPRALSLNLDEYMGLVHFEAGVQEVPISLTRLQYKKNNGQLSEPGLHWYLKQQGVKPYVKGKAAQEDPEELRKKLEAAGYKVSKNEPEPEEEETGENLPVAASGDDEARLAAMTKDQLVEYAFDNLELDLDSNKKKADLIAAIMTAKAARAA